MSLRSVKQSVKDHAPTSDNMKDDFLALLVLLHVEHDNELQLSQRSCALQMKIATVFLFSENITVLSATAGQGFRSWQVVFESFACLYLRSVERTSARVVDDFDFAHPTYVVEDTKSPASTSTSRGTTSSTSERRTCSIVEAAFRKHCGAEFWERVISKLEHHDDADDVLNTSGTTGAAGRGASADGRSKNVAAAGEKEMLKQHKDKEKENKQNPNQGRMKSSNNVKHDEEAAGVTYFQQQCLLQAVSLSLWLVHDAQQRCRAEMRKLSKALSQQQQQTQAPAVGGKKGGPPHYGAAAGVVGTTITTNSTTALQLGASTTLLPSVVSKWFHASLDLLGLLLVEHEERGWRKSKTTSLSSSHRTSSLSASAVPAKSAPSGVDEVESAITKVTSLIHVLLCRLTHFLVYCGGSQIEPMTTSTTSSAQEVASSTNIMISSSSTSKSTSGLLRQAYSTKGMRKFLACCDPENTFRVGFLSVLKDDQYAALPLPLLPPATARFLSYWLPFQTARFLARAAEATSNKNAGAGAPPHLRYDKQVIVDLYREAAENAKRLLEVAGQEYNSLYFQILYPVQKSRAPRTNRSHALQMSIFLCGKLSAFHFSIC